jgi:hypothetical protein
MGEKRQRSGLWGIKVTTWQVVTSGWVLGDESRNLASCDFWRIRVVAACQVVTSVWVLGDQIELFAWPLAQSLSVQSAMVAPIMGLCSGPRDAKLILHGYCQFHWQTLILLIFGLPRHLCSDFSFRLIRLL